MNTVRSSVGEDRVVRQHNSSIHSLSKQKCFQQNPQPLYVANQSNSKFWFLKFVNRILIHNNPSQLIILILLDPVELPISHMPFLQIEFSFLKIMRNIADH